jgi:transketolase
MSTADRWRELGQQLRVDSVRSSAAAGSGHPTSSMSAADLMAVLLDGGYLRMDTQDLDNPANDHLIFSKGHASPLYYAVLKAAGIIDDTELLTFRKLGSRLEGHPTPRIPPTDVATGSLGQGLPIAVGVALAGKRLDRLPYRVWALCGDSEMAEGSIWEAFEHAAFNGLDNLTAIIDVNRLGQTRETMVGWDLDRYVQRAEAFGWHAIAIDGHDVEAIGAAFDEAVRTTGKPTAIIAKTKKGKGVKAVEDQPGKHGKPLDDPDAAIQELGGERDISVGLAVPEAGKPHVFAVSGGELPSWDAGEQVATRQAYGETLTALGAIRGDVVALDGEVSNSTHSELFREAHEDRYFEMFIAEQQMIAAAVGMQVRGWVPFASTFSAFLTRAYDFIRMACRSARTARRRWRWRISRRSARSTARPSCIRPTPTRPPSWWRRWRTATASRSSARCAARPRSARPRTRTWRSAARASCATATTSRSWPAASRWARRSTRRSGWPATGSRRA